MKALPLLVVLATAILAVGCTSSGLSYDDVVDLGRVEYFSEPAMVDGPTTSAINTDVTFTVSTYGGGCLTFERTDVEPDGDGFLVSPFDRDVNPGKDGACADDLRFIPHAVTLTFATPGQQTVHVAGRRVTSEVDEDIEVPVSITIE
ncbi:MAG TPA: hypothetical protein VGM39_14150 [Kofleriaceae bacterium]|jgi:hypothetical protein